MKPAIVIALVFGLGSIVGLSMIIAVVPKSFNPDGRWMWGVWVFVLSATAAVAKKEGFFDGRIQAAFSGLAVTLITMIFAPVPGMIYIGIEKEGTAGVFQGLIFGIATGFYGVLFFGLMIAPVGVLFGLVARSLVLRIRIRPNATT